MSKYPKRILLPINDDIRKKLEAIVENDQSSMRRVI